MYRRKNRGVGVNRVKTQIIPTHLILPQADLILAKSESAKKKSLNKVRFPFCPDCTSKHAQTPQENQDNTQAEAQVEIFAARVSREDQK